MIPIAEDAVLGSDLDCQNFNLLNISALIPVPDTLVAIDDPRLTGSRAPPPASIINESVADLAAIDQSKINLNGPIPETWLQISQMVVPEEPQAIAGNAAEFLSKKGAVGGYAGLDSSGRIPSSSANAGAAVGTITQVGFFIKDPLSLPAGNHYITNTGTWTVQWAPAPPNSWFGTDGTPDPNNHEQILPFYVTGTAPGLSDIDASKFTSGVFLTARLPVARGVGGSHAPGMVPDPGSGGDPIMYLGRDMQWRYFTVNDPSLAQQPAVPNVTIVLDWWEEHDPTTEDPSLVKAHVTIRSLLKGSFLFYRVVPLGTAPPPFKEAHHDDTPDDVHITIEVSEHDFIQAYAARAGYNDSVIENWEVITPITDLMLPP